MSAWYDLTPADYATGLRYYAERSDVQASRIGAEGKPWSADNAERSRRQAHRLRAMALLCDISTAATAGEVDFLGMTNPSQATTDETDAIAKASALARK